MQALRWYTQRMPKAPEFVGKFNAQLVPLVRSIADLTLDKRNARRHGDRNLAAIAGSLQEFGQQKAIVVSKDGKVLAGNGTLRAAISLGWTGIAATEFDGSRDRAFAIADNRTGELAEWDYQELSATLREENDPDLFARLGWTLDEQEPLMLAEWTPPPIDPEAMTGGPGTRSGGNGAVEVSFTPDQWAIVTRATDKLPRAEADDRAAAIVEICRRFAS